ncbi:UTP--glucose-1-phosphate uridylyltransferase GalU [Desulfoscipio gibsoniae]|uniref:UTP--glucose-1-phosphate uridylyltransferase n=1 Tax=Desulfoscipio gibsoniae DSM 7213 TaxID=767817 RepID=R4KKL3_9FIRM|nr:UTP--glucose-1-phosphate uridylyltransferase GalU [Desulfoscipio gibsoniae]AGL01045.1 UTP-glucose-1-phosphate uridylyltransferase [Desulfoscipio gibsoniae DSM 7213]
MKVRKAVIPAAGLGTRFLPVTKALPKEMLPIVDKPTIQYIIEEAVNSGIEDILIITGRGKWSIVDYFDRSPELEAALGGKGKSSQLKTIVQLTKMANIYYIRQNKPLGLGHAVYCAKSFVGEEPFAVLLGDDIIKAPVPALRQLIEVAESFNSSVIGVREVPISDVGKYGIIKPAEGIGSVYRVEDLVEKPSPEAAPSKLAIMGRYVLNASIFKCLKDLPAGAGGEIQLTDALRVQSGLEPVYAYMFEGIRYDAGDKLGYLKATVEYALESSELGEQFSRYLEDLYQERRNHTLALQEVAASSDM